MTTNTVRPRKKAGRRWSRALIVLAATAAAGTAAFLFATAPQRITAAELPEHTPDLANGERMFHAAGCAGCHAEPGAQTETDRLRLAGGLALQTPFGTFHVPNISPDPETGIGGWSTLDFVNAMTRGIAPDGRHLYPAFPYTSYQRMRLEDIIDLKAFLDTLPPVTSSVPPHDLPFPYSVRRGIGLWKLFYLDGRPFTPDPAQSEEVNRGAYLVLGPGHCGECHTPRNALGALDWTRAFAGAPDPDGSGFIPNITPDSSGIGSWSKDDIVEALTSGFTPEFDSLGGAMAEVVRSTSKLPEADREAIAAYLKSLPARPATRPAR